MRITLNGTAAEVEGTTLSAALNELGYGGARVATAVNETFVPATRRADHALRDGDRVEVLAPRQGG